MPPRHVNNLGSAAISMAVVAFWLCDATPAHGTEMAYTVSPTSGPAGTTITVSSSTRCPDPPSGTAFDHIDVVVIDHAFQTTVGRAEVDPDPDGSWSTEIRVSRSSRNGAYRVLVDCVSNDVPDDAAYDSYEPVREFVVTSPSGQQDPVVRIAGVDRIETAVAASQDVFKTGTDVAVLSRSDSFADALAGTPFASLFHAPLLLTPSDRLDGRTEHELQRVLGTDGSVVLLGGTAALGEAVQARIEQLGYDVVRLAGVNRYETAIVIADVIGDATGNLTTALLTDGNGFRDGLVAGAAAMVAANPEGPSGPQSATPAGVVLLTNGDQMAAETANWLENHADVARYAVGGPAARAAPAAPAIVGSNAAETSRKVAEKFFASTASVAVASSANFPDALSGGAHATAFDSPLLFTDPSALPGTINDYLVSLKSQLVIGFVYGGTAAVSEEVRTAIVQAIS